MGGNSRTRGMDAILTLFPTIMSFYVLCYYVVFLGLVIMSGEYDWLLGTILVAQSMSLFYFGDWFHDVNNNFSIAWIPQFYIFVAALVFYTPKIRYSKEKKGFYHEPICFNTQTKKEFKDRSQKGVAIQAFAFALIIQHIALALSYAISLVLYQLMRHVIMPKLPIQGTVEFAFYTIYGVIPLYWIIGHLVGAAIIYINFEKNPKGGPAILTTEHVVALTTMYSIMMILAWSFFL